MNYETTLSIQEILRNLKIVHPLSYLLSALGLNLIVRLILTYFKALAIINGEIDDDKKTEENEVKWKGKKRREAFWASFRSKEKDLRIDDCWIPAYIGLAELIVFPILMSEGCWAGIGAWILIKTASSWGGWQKTRTAYNRFLLGNILSLGCSVLLSWFFIK